MDEERQIRLAIPPFFLLASLLWGAHVGGVPLSPIFKPETLKEVLGLLGAAAVSVVPVGYLISVLSVALLRFVAWICRTPTYEAVLGHAALDRIWRRLHSERARGRADTLYVAATFDHEILADRIHMWLVRRWNSFNVAAHSVVALLLSHAVAPVFSVPQTWRWWVTTGVIEVFLIFTAYGAWCQTMGMLEFQSHRAQQAGSEDAGANG